MASSDQTDISHFDQPVAEIQRHVDDLHAHLDGFAEGTTQQLTGQRARNAVYHALYGLDSELKHVHELRAGAAPRLRGHVTAAMRDKLRRAQTMADTFHEVLRRALEEGRDRKLLLTLENLGLLASEFRRALASLEEDVQPTTAKDSD